MGQHGVFDADEFQRGARRVGVVGGHRRNLVADEADAGVEDAHVRGETPPP